MVFTKSVVYHDRKETQTGSTTWSARPRYKNDVIDSRMMQGNQMQWHDQSFINPNPWWGLDHLYTHIFKTGFLPFLFISNPNRFEFSGLGRFLCLLVSLFRSTPSFCYSTQNGDTSHRLARIVPSYFFTGFLINRNQMGRWDERVLYINASSKRKGSKKGGGVNEWTGGADGWMRLDVANAGAAIGRR